MSPANRCFHNSLVVQNIVKHFDASEGLYLRLINRTCDKEVLRQMRRLFRAVRIEVESENLPKIRINGWLVKPRECFKFLINKVGVIVEELEVIRVGELDSSVAQVLHNDILNVLIKDKAPKVFKGMRSLCRSCDQCGKYAIHSKEYGPVQSMGLLDYFQEPKHFDKLIVDYQLLWYILRYCPKNRRNQSNQLLIMKMFIHSRISCDHLQLQLYDELIDRIGPEPVPRDDSLPREILEEMCKTWNVKSIGISFQSENRSELGSRISENMLTKLYWDEDYRRTSVSTGFLLDFVEVDLEKAPVQFDGVFGTKGSPYLANDHLIANIRKVFPAKHYYFIGNWMSSANDSGEMNNFQLTRMLSRATFGASESNNAPVTIRHRMRPGDQFIDFSVDLNRTFISSKLNGPIKVVINASERVGWFIKVQEEETGCEINVEVYVTRKIRKPGEVVQPSESIVNVSSESSEAVGHLEIQKPLSKFKMESFGKALILTIATILFVAYFAWMLF